MYKLVFTLTILAFNLSATFGQSKDDPGPCTLRIDSLTKQEVYIITDRMPTPQGGHQALYRVLSKKIKLQPDARYSIESKIIVAFIIDAKGQVTGKRTIRNIQGTTAADQLLDLIDDVAWEPGACNGKAVSVLLALPMIIDLK